jgi:penicillin amidase
MRLLRFLLTTVVAGLAFGAWTVRRSFPVTKGSATLAALSGPVTVVRDEAGVPHIAATTLEDLFRAQGYVHAQDRFWQMDTWRHIGAGRLAEMFGESQVDRYLPSAAGIRTSGGRGVHHHVAPTPFRSRRLCRRGQCLSG